MAETVFLGLGSNLGDRLSNLRAAVTALPPGVIDLHSSRVYETPPWGFEEQPAFLNQVVTGKTELTPEELLSYVKAIERRMGRRKTRRFGPRVIDIDILFYADWVVNRKSLKIPHPQIAARAFVLVPLADLAPDLRHPQSGVSVTAMLAKVEREGIEVFAPGNMR